MGKFKVGDRVRVVDNIGSPDEYKVGEICTVSLVEAEDDDFTFGDYIQVEGKSSGMFSSRFELVEQPATWQPKVGDRVRIVKPRYDFKEGHKGREFTITEQQATIDGEPAWVGYPESRPYIWATSELEPVQPLPVAEQPAALKIEAGKFYRTRDGRKVGPMETMPWTDDEMSVLIDGEARVFSVLGGEHVYGLRELDLIAEWADEPAAAPATPVAATASNDNAPVAEPKFKVGDRVCLWDGDVDHGTVTAFNGARYSVHWDSHELPDESLIWRDSELQHVPVAPVAPQQSTAGFTIPLVDDEKDGSTQLTVRITSDFTDLHEQIDYAFERLKKLKKKARKLGIDLQFDKAA